jgi:hypothetical protein
MTPRGFLVGFLRSPFHFSSHVASILSFMSVKAFFLYFSMKIAMASMSHWEAMCPERWQASQTRLRSHLQLLRSGRTNQPHGALVLGGHEAPPRLLGGNKREGDC